MPGTVLQKQGRDNLRMMHEKNFETDLTNLIKVMKNFDVFSHACYVLYDSRYKQSYNRRPNSK